MHFLILMMHFLDKDLWDMLYHQCINALFLPISTHEKAKTQAFTVSS